MKKRKLTVKFRGLAMMLKGFGGEIINFVASISDDLSISRHYQILPRGYIVKGFGHFIGSRQYIKDGMELIQRGKRSIEYLNKSFYQI